MSKKKALIITDGSKSIRAIALFLKEALDEYKVKICTAKKFAGTDLLAADIFFIGSKKQKPKSFAYLEEMLSHINLASRRCSVFSVSEKGFNYLCSFLKNSEADLKEPLLIPEEKIEKAALKKWFNKLK